MTEKEFWELDAKIQEGMKDVSDWLKEANDKIEEIQKWMEEYK